ncbi:MarR family winged helix-turn-helix transcriptional regulator [Haloglycomyces albus]|uniref:MarR family winged helix-turn-helix transcriptional regulator n=1 Tax=Haloglycomyces albus TaxID=526067 RepID=UPI00046C97E2|nr:MarR family transcriptional regulator [Haloglycomyces albus]
MDDNLLLRDQVCFALYSASRAVTSTYRPLLDKHGLTYPQYLVLLALWETDGRTVTDLGSALRLDSGTLSPLLKRLEAIDLIEKRRAAADERRVAVHLTSKGSDLREEMRCIPSQVAGASGLSTRELTDLKNVLNQITEEINRTEKETS